MSFSSIVSSLRKNYIIAGSAFIAIVCLGIHFVRSEQITRLAADYDDLSVNRTRILKNLKHASEIDVDLKTLKEMEKEVDSRLFSPEDLATNQRYFYRIESATGIELESIQQMLKALPTGKQAKKARMLAEKSEFQEIVYDMNVRGSYEEVLSFLKELEGGRAFTVMDGFAIVQSKGKADESMVSMRVTVDVFGRKS